MHELRAAWETFYVIVGSSAGALIGLQFVAIALIAETRRRSSSRELEAFGTPTILHLCASLLIAAILTAPWPSLRGVRTSIAVCGVAGVVYVGIVMRRATKTPFYKPVLEDWIWHAVLPFTAYATLLAAGLELISHVAGSLFAIAGASLLLLFIGIHNAWDAVTYIALEHVQEPNP